MNNNDTVLSKSAKRQNWYFTFPHTSKHREEYVKIHGTYASARYKMSLLFKDKWASQYGWKAFRPLIKRYDFTELRG